MSTVLLAVFNDSDVAARVREVLVQDGFPTDRVDLTSPRDLGRAQLEPASTFHDKCVQYFRTLLGREGDRDYPEMLARRIDNGAATVTVLPRGAIETERAKQILQYAQPAEIVGHDLENYGWEHAAAKHDDPWAKYIWVEHSPNAPDCIYCRLFPDLALSAPWAHGPLRRGSTHTPTVERRWSDTKDAGIPSRMPRSQEIRIRHVDALSAFEWLRRGWDDLWHMRASSLIHGVLIATLGAVLLILGSSHPYFVAAAISGYLLIGPIMTTGICELSRRRAAGEPLGFDDSLQGLARNPQELLKFGAILAGITAVWFVASEIMLRSVLNSPGPTTAEILWGDFTAAASRDQVITYVASGAVLACLVFALSVVSVPLIIDRRVSATEAIRASVNATLSNLPAMLVWSALIVVLTALGFLTMLVGMIIVAPLLGHATWHAYRALVA